MKVKGFARSRMRESRTYGSVRGWYRKVPVYSIVELTTNACISSFLSDSIRMRQSG